MLESTGHDPATLMAVAGDATIAAGVVAELADGRSVGPLRLDLSGVDHIDSRGLAALLEADRKATCAGRSLVLVNLPTQFKELLQSVGLAHHFTIGRALPRLSASNANLTSGVLVDSGWDEDQPASRVSASES